MPLKGFDATLTGSNLNKTLDREIEREISGISALTKWAGSPLLLQLEDLCHKNVLEIEEVLKWGGVKFLNGYS